MFDERSEKWIKIFKIYTQVMFWLCIVAGIILCVLGWAEELWWREEAFFDGLICLVVGIFAAFAQLEVNMLILQMLNNINVIREKLESK